MHYILSKCSLTALFEEACFFGSTHPDPKEFQELTNFFFFCEIHSQIEIQFQNQIQSVGNYIPLIQKKKRNN
jgi:hypothetical protein